MPTRHSTRLSTRHWIWCLQDTQQDYQQNTEYDAYKTLNKDTIVSHCILFVGTPNGSLKDSPTDSQRWYQSHSFFGMLSRLFVQMNIVKLNDAVKSPLFIPGINKYICRHFTAHRLFIGDYRRYMLSNWFDLWCLSRYLDWVRKSSWLGSQEFLIGFVRIRDWFVIGFLIGFVRVRDCLSRWISLCDMFVIWYVLNEWE